MIEKLIREYVDRMTLQDVESFATSHGVVLNEEEKNLIFKEIKTHWHTIVYGNPRGILDNLKKQFEPLTYQKIENLYVYFKQKFKNYL